MGTNKHPPPRNIASYTVTIDLLVTPHDSSGWAPLAGSSTVSPLTGLPDLVDKNA